MLNQFLPGYSHIQSNPSDSWEIIHNLNRCVCVDVFVNFQGKFEKIMPRNVVVVDENTMRIEFTAPMSGQARLL